MNDTQTEIKKIFSIMKIRNALSDSEYLKFLKTIEEEYDCLVEKNTLICENLHCQINSVLADNSKFRVLLTGVLDITEAMKIKKMVDPNCHDILKR